MLLAVLFIIGSEIILNENVIASFIGGGITIVVFSIVLTVIYKGYYEVGINILILLGFVRLFMIFFYPTPFQFYAMLSVLLISVNVIYYKPYQATVASVGGLIFVIAQAFRIKVLADAGSVNPRSISEAGLSIYLFIA